MPHGIRVACGDGALAITMLQRPGGRRLTAAEFLQREPLAPGTRFGAAQCRREALRRVDRSAGEWRRLD